MVSIDCVVVVTGMTVWWVDDRALPRTHHVASPGAGVVSAAEQATRPRVGTDAEGVAVLGR